MPDSSEATTTTYLHERVSPPVSRAEQEQTAAPMTRDEMTGYLKDLHAYAADPDAEFTDAPPGYKQDRIAALNVVINLFHRQSDHPAAALHEVERFVHEDRRFRDQLTEPQRQEVKEILTGLDEMIERPETAVTMREVAAFALEQQAADRLKATSAAEQTARAEAARAKINGATDGPNPAGPEHQSQATLAERHPDWPQFKFNYVLGSHGSAEDFADFTQHLAAADILLIEGGGLDAEDQVRRLQKVADADPSVQSVDEFIADNYPGLKGRRELQVRALYGTRKAVGSIDLRGPEAKELAIGTVYREIQPNYLLPDYDATINDFAAKVERSAQVQRQREKTMPGRVEAELQRILSERPQLLQAKAQGRPLEIYAPMGADHPTLVRDLAASKLGLDITSEAPPLEDYSYESELRMQYMAGEEPSRELKQRAYVERVILGQLQQKFDEYGSPQSEDTMDHNAYLRHIASAFSGAEIRDIYRNQRVDPLTPHRTDNILKRLGLGELPRNAQQLHAMVSTFRQNR